ncbi:MAG: 2-dehydro-3-deoxygalactonokinase [Roseovarius sp.]
MPGAWGAALLDGGRVTLYAVEGGRIAAHDFASVDGMAKASGIAAERLVTLDAAVRGSPPAKTLDVASGTLGALQQAGPAALLPPEARVLIAGALAAQPDWDGIMLIPEADVTHWVHVSAREIVSFQGAATGRLAAALGAYGDALDASALSDTMSRPERLAAHLNAAALTGASAAVLGHLMGAELAAMRAYWLGQELRIIGPAAPYAKALEAQGVIAEAVPRAKAWEAGIHALAEAAGLTG